MNGVNEQPASPTVYRFLNIAYIICYLCTGAVFDTMNYIIYHDPSKVVISQAKIIYTSNSIAMKIESTDMMPMQLFIFIRQLVSFLLPNFNKQCQKCLTHLRCICFRRVIIERRINHPGMV